MNRSLLKLMIAVVMLCAIAPATPAAAAPKTCVHKGAKTSWHKHGVRVYSIESKVYACSNTFGKRILLESADFASESFGIYRTNGRYLFYVREFVGPTTSYGSIGRMLDLKTRESTKTLGDRDFDPATLPECASPDRFCSRGAHGAAIGPGRSFVIGYRMGIELIDHRPVGTTHVIERHCFQPGLKNPTVTLLDTVSSVSDLASIKSASGKAHWISGGKKKSAPFC